MAINLDLDKCINILKENGVDNKALLTSYDNDTVFGIYLYFKLQIIFKEDLSHLKAFDKIPHIKLIRWCTWRKIYEGPEAPKDTNIGLKDAKYIIEKFMELGFISDEKHEFGGGIPKGNLLSLSSNSSLHITDIGKLLVEELEKYISVIDHDIALIKSMLISPEVIDRAHYRNNINEKFVKTYLDYLQYGGLHV